MKAIKKFMQDHYTDERLAALLAHAQDGKLCYASCCCFIGVVTANHPLKSDIQDSYHYQVSRKLRGAFVAEAEFCSLGKDNAGRRAALIPLIVEEMERREKLRGATQTTSELIAV